MMLTAPVSAPPLHAPGPRAGARGHRNGIAAAAGRGSRRRAGARPRNSREAGDAPPPARQAWRAGGCAAAGTAPRNSARPGASRGCRARGASGGTVPSTGQCVPRGAELTLLPPSKLCGRGQSAAGRPFFARRTSASLCVHVQHSWESSSLPSSSPGARSFFYQWAPNSWGLLDNQRASSRRRQWKQCLHQTFKTNRCGGRDGARLHTVYKADSLLSA